MKTILTTLILLLSLSVYSQENPWENQMNISENPWLSEEQKLKMIEEEKAKILEEEKIKREEMMRIQELEKAKDSGSVSSSSNDHITTIPKIDASTRLADLRAKGTDIYKMGYTEAEKRFHANGMGALGFCITLVPIIGNPIVWIMAGSYPGEHELAKNHEKNKEYLNDPEYLKGYKKSARRTRAGKLMIGNLFGNITKLVFFLALVN